MNPLGPVLLMLAGLLALVAVAPAARAQDQGWQPPATMALTPPRADPCTTLASAPRKTKRSKAKTTRLAPPDWPGLSADVAARRASYWPQVLRTACAKRLPPLLLDALIMQESRYDSRALSRVGAAGLTQLMPGTAFELGVFNPLDPAANLRGGATYLRRMLDRFATTELALAAYNAGPGAVERSGGIPAFAETRTYVERVTTTWRAMDPRPITVPVPRLDDSLPEPSALSRLARAPLWLGAVLPVDGGTVAAD
jgi:soluble lytic murein transglycosylase-like protein